MTQPGERETMIAELRRVSLSGESARGITEKAADLLEADAAELAAYRELAVDAGELLIEFAQESRAAHDRGFELIGSPTAAMRLGNALVALAAPTLADEKGEGR